MGRINRHAARDLSYSLLGPDHLPVPDEELSQRDVRQAGKRSWRELKSGEIDQLTRQGNTCDDWGSVLVSEHFHPRFIHGCRFRGLVRIGNLQPFVLEAGGVRAPVGLYHSTLVSCDLGDDVCIERVGYLAHYIVGDGAMIQRVGRMSVSRAARFGWGGLKQGMDPDAREWIDAGNENGGRAIVPFVGMRIADAALWARYRGDAALMQRLIEFSDRAGDPHPGWYGAVAGGAVIRGCHAIVDVNIGPGTLIDEALELEDVTLASTEEEPLTIGAGARLRHVIVGPGCRVDGSAQVGNSLLGPRVSIGRGARVSHCVVGDNSTIECCEVVSNLIFPFHEQHHNNSFLIASTLLGQSNIAAGATIGSNHNSRAADGEILAGRGFWPGLCTDFKHNCRFASFVLVAKGSYPAELHIPLPFSLVSQNAEGDGLAVMPAYWLMHNMYAVLRNQWKFGVRDKRLDRSQHIEIDSLAPDTVEEIFTALDLLERWTGEAFVRGQKKDPSTLTPEELSAVGRKLLRVDPEVVGRLELTAHGLENGKRPVHILKAASAWAMYREVLHHYAVRSILRYMEAHQIHGFDVLVGRLSGPRERRWINLGGQLVPGSALDELRHCIQDRIIDSWEEFHGALDDLWGSYPEARTLHALGAMLDLNGWRVDQLNPSNWTQALSRSAETQRKIARLTMESRAKDYASGYRKQTYADEAEMEAVLGTLDDNPFLERIAAETDAYCELTARIIETINTTTAGSG